MLQVIVGPPPLRTQLETGPACAAATRTPLDSRIDSVLKTPLAGEPTNLLPMVIGFPLLLRSVGVPTGSWPRSWTCLEGLNNSLSSSAAGRWAVARPKPKAGKATIAAAINTTDLMPPKRQFPLISILLDTENRCSETAR